MEKQPKRRARQPDNAMLLHMMDSIFLQHGTEMDPEARKLLAKAAEDYTIEHFQKKNKKKKNTEEKKQ